MKYAVMSLLVLVLLGVGCGQKKELPAGVLSGTVKETMNASSYTYMLLKEGEKEYWIAGPQMQVAVGDEIFFVQGMEMKNFKSTTLNKTFDSIYFVDRASKKLEDLSAAPPPGMPNQTVTPPSEMPDNHPKVEGITKRDLLIEKVEGGYTVDELIKQAAQLNGKAVKIRGHVTKVNAGILNKNWAHIQDGTGTDSAFDLLVTTAEVVNPETVYVFEGTLKTNVDFGAGYKYDVLIEDAKIIK